jgi:hypothetical protein
MLEATALNNRRSRLLNNLQTISEYLIQILTAAFPGYTLRARIVWRGCSDQHFDNHGQIRVR